jgi:hypothetical protein
VNPGEAPPIDTNDKIQAWLERAEKANLLSKKQAELEKIEE